MKKSTRASLVIISACVLFMVNTAAYAQTVFKKESLVRQKMKNQAEQDLTGNWRIAGFQPGLGYYDGTYTFKPDPDKGEDEYLIERKVRYDRGIFLKQTGSGTLCSKYHLRYVLVPNAFAGRIEGVFDLDAARQEFGGRWKALVQDSNSYGDEKSYKVDGSKRIFAIVPKALEVSGNVGQKLTLIGTNLPKDIKAANIEFSDPGVKAAKVETADGSRIVCSVTVAPKRPGKKIGLSVKGIESDEALMVYEGLDGLKILPALGRARVGCGAAYPPQGVQFVAWGIDFGSDNRPGTEDDVLLKPLNAVWRLEEEATREDDDDLKYLNAPIDNGLYTPVTTCGPIAEKAQSREGVGLIAVIASYNDGDRMIRDRALLAVTAPYFIPHMK